MAPFFSPKKNSKDMIYVAGEPYPVKGNDVLISALQIDTNIKTTSLEKIFDPFRDQSSKRVIKENLGQSFKPERKFTLKYQSANDTRRCNSDDDFFNEYNNSRDMWIHSGLPPYGLGKKGWSGGPLLIQGNGIEYIIGIISCGYYEPPNPASEAQNETAREKDLYELLENKEISQLYNCSGTIFAPTVEIVSGRAFAIDPLVEKIYSYIKCFYKNNRL
jgi:hypothetical protein